MPAPSVPSSLESPYWRQNLLVCLFGSFTTIVGMTLLLPYLPLYVEKLGVRGHAAIVQWSGVAYSATFLTAALTAPIWGRLGDRYGRKSMLLRASLGMAITMSLIGLAQNVWQLVALRLLAGVLGGYSSGSTILVAAQTPKARSAWALGALSVGVMAGNLLGPLLGGVAPEWIGIRATFFLSGGLIFVAFLATCFVLKEVRPPGRVAQPVRGSRRLRDLPQLNSVLALLATASLLMLATMSIEPIITVYVSQLSHGGSHVSAVSGVVMATGAAGAILSAQRVGRLADRVGHSRVILGCLVTAGALLLLQAAVTDVWELGVLRLAMGLSLGGLLPSITASIRHLVPDTSVGQVLGLSVSAQFAGQVIGPLLGGFVGGHVGMRAVFLDRKSVV